jgi:flagellin-like hook-associated protein FlgL
MSSINTSSSRVSTASTADSMLTNLRRTQAALLDLQTQISTNKRINKPSDDAGAYSAISRLNTLAAKYDQQISDLSTAGNAVAGADGALSDLSDLLLSAQNIASSQIGVDSDSATRNSQADIIDSMLDSVVALGNRDQSGIYLFSGRTSGTQPFVSDTNGIRYTGSSEQLTTNFGGVDVDLNASGGAALGALSSRVTGTVDLNPGASATTRILDVNGARALGVTLGSVTLNVDGTAVNVDLTNAGSLGNVRDLINNAVNAIDPTAGGLAVGPNGFSLTAPAGHTIAIADQGTGITAADLGIAISANGATTAGGDLDPKLTLGSSLAGLGATVDLTSGLKVTSGATTKIIDLSGATTVQGLVNAVQSAGLGLRLEINGAGTGFNLINEVSGNTVSIGENAGGTTATDLGLRSLTGATNLSDFNHGQGVSVVGNGQDDFGISLHDGSTVNVKLQGAQTVQDVIDAINAAGAGTVTASLATDGNGIVLSDTTAGASAFKVAALNGSSAAANLGIVQNAGLAATINGTDNATVRTESVFTHLIALRDALRRNDTQAITNSGGSLGTDVSNIAAVRGTMGVRAQHIEAEKNRASEQKLQTATLLSGVQDTDLTEAITRFTQLQQQLQATLQTGSKVMQLSLLDFLT